MKVQVPPSAPSPKPRAQRGATFVAITAVWAHWFKATHPHGVRRITSAAGFYGNWFQSTHPHGVRPGTYENYSLCVKFQSTHPHGVRHLVLDTVKTASSFQSTHPHGVRPGHDRRRAKLDGVSIHAPSRGATFVIHIFAVRSCFNPRTLTGCDIDCLSEHRRQLEFQSTHPHGVRRQLETVTFSADMFQSTHPHGVRHRSSDD